MLLGVMDDAMLLYRTNEAFDAFDELHPQIIRFDADWPLIAKRRPANPRNPDDPAYDFAKTDEIVQRAKAQNIAVLLTIGHTPEWAGGTKKHNRVPKKLTDLQSFSYAIARRYSGKWKDEDGNVLPRVSRWEAWNEPNTATHLSPQYVCKGGKGFWCKGGKFLTTSPKLYAGLLNAIYKGVHAAGATDHVSQVVAGGATKPTGGGPTAFEPSIAPLKFLRLLGKRKMDAYAHHPYRSLKTEKSTGDNVGFDALGKLITQLDKLQKPRKLPLWITEYGVQTNPPDRFQGVTPAKQAAYLRNGVSVAKRNPRIQMLIWFLLRDEAIGSRRLAAGFQTGLAYENGKPKPAWTAFRSLTP
jgi:hypothetical protein